MKLRFPLFAKILLWFFLNLLLLGGTVYVFFRVQFHMGLDTLFTGKAGERIEALGNIVFDELRAASAEDRPEVLQYFGSRYGVQILLVRPDGETIAGEATFLPREVRNHLVSFGAPQTPPSADNAHLQPPLDGTRFPHPKFMVHSTEPSGYWVGMRLPPFDHSRPDSSSVLLLFSPTLSGGLFMDFKPWLLVGFGALLLSVLFWLPLIRGITHSIKQLTIATGQIAKGRFDVRVNEARRDELGRLGAEINRMAGQLNGFIVGQKRFLGDAAHELCSPLARMQVALGILEQRADEKQRAYVDDVCEEVQHMSSLVNELLSFTKAGLHEKEVQLKPVALVELAHRVVAREAGDSNQVQIQITNDLHALAEPDLLARALANLIRNAIRYAGHAGPVTISVVAQNGHLILTVADAGPGVPEDSLQQIFDPFFRLETSRSRDSGGIGLGLAIVKTCVQVCQGTVTAKNRQPSGLQVDITLLSAASGSAPLPSLTDSFSANLQSCPDCGRQVSTRAVSCPHCRAPSTLLIEPAKVREDVSSTLPSNATGALFKILAVLIVIAAVVGGFFVYTHYQKTPILHTPSAQTSVGERQNSNAFPTAKNTSVKDDEQKNALREAVESFRKAAEQGDAQAEWHLGQAYEQGKGVPQDNTEAVKWYRKAAEHGNAKAQLQLGGWYEKGTNVTKDYREAVKWYRKVAEQGDAGAQFLLGLYYQFGQGVPEDYVEAAKWYRKAAEQGDAEAQYSLAELYADGNGLATDSHIQTRSQIQANYVEAAKWYRKAAEQGDAEAQYSLAELYADGNGLAKDYVEAAKWWRKGAEQGIAAAQFRLAELYETGKGVAKDYIEAYKWYEIAATQPFSGNTAAEERDSLAGEMTKNQITEGHRQASEFLAKRNRTR